MKLTKTESFVHKNRKQIISLQVKFLLCSEICYSSENSLCSENFAIVEKFCYNSEIASVSPACFCFLLNQLIHSWLDAIEDKSYELDVNQLNFDMPSLI